MREILGFFVAAYAVTWSAWIAANGVHADVPRTALIVLGTFAPGIVAVCLTGQARGRPGINALPSRLFVWQVHLRWYLFAVGYLIFKDIVPSADTHATDPWALSHSLVAWMTVALLWLCAAWFLLRMRRNPGLTRAVARQGSQ